MKGMTRACCQREPKNRRRKTFGHASEDEVHVDVRENNVIDKTVDDTALAARFAGHAGQLAIGIVERICENMERHANDVQAQISIIIEMSRAQAE